VLGRLSPCVPETLGFHRALIFGEATAAFMALPPSSFRKIFRFDLLDEPGLDAGGVAREVFALLSERLVDPEAGLFLPAEGTATTSTYQVTPHPRPAELPPATLALYRFAGRFMGKALVDGHVIGLHLALPVLKRLIGTPASFDDLEALDSSLFRSLQALKDDPGMAASLGLDFSLTYDMRPWGGGKVDGTAFFSDGLGATGSADWDREVTPANCAEFVELRWRRRCEGDVGPQLDAMAAGLADVLGGTGATGLAESKGGILGALFREAPGDLDVLLAGLGEVDVKDWRAHTDYKGKAFNPSDHASGRPSKKEPGHKVVKWFWEWVGALGQADRARLLRFVTGCGGVPCGGFGALLGNDGKGCRFTLQAIDLSPKGAGEAGASTNLPRAHTCFNRLDLPLFATKADLEATLSAVLQEDLAITGFGMD
jgi:hypothetical protein